MTTAISLQAVSKRFRLPLDRSTTLKYRLVHWGSTSRYRDLWALRDVSFDVDFGEFVGIIGRNGSGKSTLLKVLSRILTCTSGRVNIAGSVSPFLELGVGFNPELTARENIFVNGTILGLSSAELRDRVAKILAFAELEEFAEQKLKNFSSGMQVRLAFAVAIEADAGILLMDEVLAVGDAPFQEKCFDVFSRYRREGRTVVLVTHDLGAVENFCDRAILLDHGGVVADDSAIEVTRRYRHMVGEGTSLAAAPDEIARWGSGEARIEDLVLVDGENRPAQAFSPGSPLEIRVTLRAAQPVDEVVCSIAIQRADGLVVSASDTHIGGTLVPALSADETVALRYRIPALALLAGTYRVAVAIHGRYSPQPIDHQEGFVFRVHDDQGRPGIVEVGGMWTVEKPQGSTLISRSA